MCTYFEPYQSDMKGAQDYTITLDLWRASWIRWGWRTKILSEVDARAHPQYEYLRDQFIRLPTVNPKAYELSCYLRWIAAIQSGCGNI